ncbi:MAG: hypothetical protein DNFNHJIP_00724 [Candidatus Argoarchaeum ethanivorans]|uniref:Uncharacterized protein n=1 Tax=Candidatus Argoarchaeum ethanivorans TaxID=2608793 RepID=A0A812A108_9EURY|nr:MAG: hypothetical protein DNFNHJIP_00724 [Candidatus Argoarchaeum ethanivorans]
MGFVPSVEQLHRYTHARFVVDLYVVTASQHRGYACGAAGAE